jgi:hypothetical protein
VYLLRSSGSRMAIIASNACSPTVTVSVGSPPRPTCRDRAEAAERSPGRHARSTRESPWRFRGAHSLTAMFKEVSPAG